MLPLKRSIANPRSCRSGHSATSIDTYNLSTIESECNFMRRQQLFLEFVGDLQRWLQCDCRPVVVAIECHHVATGFNGRATLMMTNGTRSRWQLDIMICKHDFPQRCKSRS